MRILGNKVLIEPLAQPDRTPGGVVLPTNYLNPATHNQFRVVAIGQGRRNRKGELVPIELLVGDFVLAECVSDHVTLESGRKIVDAGEIIAKWGPAYDETTTEKIDSGSVPQSGVASDQPERPS